jgi:hypothetical protein
MSGQKHAHRFRVRLAALVGLLLVGLTGSACTRIVYKTAYNTADFLLMRQIDNYFDLQKEQRNYLSGRLDQLHAWHRYKELPRYAATLKELRIRFARGLEPADVDWLFARGNDFRDTVYHRIYLDAVVFLKMIRAPQVAHLREALAESNEEIVEELKLPQAKRLEKRRTKTLDFLEDWTGGLHPRQNNQVTTLVARLPELDAERLRFRQERHREFLASLPANGSAPARLEQILQAWLHQPEKSRPAFYAQALASWRASFRQMVIKIDRGLDASQRRRVLERLNTLILDLEELSRS